MVDSGADGQGIPEAVAKRAQTPPHEPLRDVRRKPEKWPAYHGQLRPAGYPTIELSEDEVAYATMVSVNIKTGRALPSSSVPQTDRDDFVALCDFGVDKERVKIPLAASDFEEEYRAYKERIIGQEGTGYRRFIETLATDTLEKIGETGEIPTAFVAIPSRRENHTSQAVEAIAGDFKPTKPGEKLFFLVLHNDVAQPTEETMADLAKIKERNDSFVMDVAFEPENTVGDARAIMADVAMEVCLRLKKNLPLIQADSDLTKIGVEGSTDAVLNSLFRDTAAVRAVNITDIDTVEANKTFALKTEIKNMVLLELAKMGKDPSQSLNGAFSAVNLIALMKLGGVPRIRMGEDKVLGDMINNHFGIESIPLCPMREAYVEVSGSRHATVEGRGEARYTVDGWQQESNQMRSEASDAPLIVDEKLLKFINGQFWNLAQSFPPGPDWKRPLTKISPAVIAICNRYGLSVQYNEETLEFELVS